MIMIQWLWKIVSCLKDDIDSVVMEKVSCLKDDIDSVDMETVLV